MLMPDWEAEQCLRFANERTQPAIDLLARVAVASPRRVADLGCGPGSSTVLLHQRWPHAEIVGVDSSVPMIAAAREVYPDWQWELADVAQWEPPAPCDLLFSNAALQWVPDHERLLPRLLEHVAPGGALAVQMPAHLDSPVHRAMLSISKDVAWGDRLEAATTALRVETPGAYYDWLQPLSRRIDLWITEYLHVLDGPSAILDWMRGTGLRPFLQALSDDAERKRFQELLLTEVAKGYPLQRNGTVLFPFRRLFLIAFR
jgi:trans-aconitate 2-methyltransferase